MNPILCQHNPKRRRFSLPNDIWKWGLKPQGFSILAYLCYLHVHCNKNASPSADEIASQLHMSADMAAEQLSKLNRCGLLDQHMAPVFKNTSKNFFSLPNELFFLNIGHGASPSTPICSTVRIAVPINAIPATAPSLLQYTSLCPQ